MRDFYKHLAHPKLNLNILIWNCRALGNNMAITSVKDLSCRFNPDLVILMETMINGDKLESQANKLPFDIFKIVDARGLRGGILLLWNFAVEF